MHNKEFNPPQILMITTIKDVRYKVLFTNDVLTENLTLNLKDRGGRPRVRISTDLI